MAEAVAKLKNGDCDYIYLPNTRWFKGEEAKDASADAFAANLASYADIYINDAFGSWQPHASTYHITKCLPSYAGLLMLKELSNLNKVFEPKRPLLAVVAGSKFDTKIGPPFRPH
jgi:phosphoglycerate kinase